MYRGTPYLNKHIKRLQEQRSMQFHLANLTHIRPRTGTLQNTGDVHINKKKGQMQKEARFTEIQRQNRILLQKISSIMGKQPTKNTRRTESQQKVNRSLNSQLRKRQLQNIQVQNAKLLKRLQQKRPNYETQKFHQSWKKQKYVIKNLSNYPFIISDKKKKRSSISQIGGRDTKNNTIQLCRMREIDGVNFLITIRLNSQRLQIIGDTKDKKQIKVIEIQRKEAVEFIQQECEGKIQRIFQCLRYDKVDQVMYLVASEVDIEDARNNQLQNKQKKDNNPQFDVQCENQQQQVQPSFQDTQHNLQGQIPIKVTNGSQNKKYWVQVQKKKDQKTILIQNQDKDGNGDVDVDVDGDADVDVDGEQQLINKGQQQQIKDEQRKDLKTEQGRRKKTQKKTQKNEDKNEGKNIQNNQNARTKVEQNKKVQVWQQKGKEDKNQKQNETIISQAIKQTQDGQVDGKKEIKQKKQQIKQKQKQQKIQDFIENGQGQIDERQYKQKIQNQQQHYQEQPLQNQQIVEDGYNRNNEVEENYEEQLIEEQQSGHKKQGEGQK